MSIFIYGLVCPIEKVIRYVGKTNNPTGRLRRHISDARSKGHTYHAAHWLRKLIADGLKPELVILHELSEGESWQEIERHWIAKSKEAGYSLTNSTLGGEGVVWADQEAYSRHLAKASLRMQELSRTLENRKQRSIISKAYWANPEFKKKAVAAIRARCSTPEHRIKMSDVSTRSHSSEEYKLGASARAKAQRSNPKQEAKLQEAFKQAMPKRLKSFALTAQTVEYKAMRTRVNREIADRPGVAATRQKTLQAIHRDPILSARHRKAMASPEVRKKISDAAKRRSTAEYRAHMSSKAVERSARPEFKSRQSASMKKYWADPARRAGSLAVAGTAESRARKAEAARRRWENPEYRAKMEASSRAGWLKRKSK